MAAKDLLKEMVNTAKLEKTGMRRLPVAWSLTREQVHLFIEAMREEFKMKRKSRKTKGGVA